MNLGQLTVTHRVRTRGDAAVWVAPRMRGPGVVPVLHFTAPDGTGYAVTLTQADLARLHTTTDRILRASPDDFEEWMDEAAYALASMKSVDA